jgi:hypothetical protein
LPKPQTVFFSEVKAPVMAVAAGAGAAAAIVRLTLYSKQGKVWVLHTFWLGGALANVFAHHGYLDLVSTL